MIELLPSGKSEGYEVCADDVALAVISPVAARNRAQAGVGCQGGFAPPCAAALPLTACRPISHGGSWMPSIGQAPDWHDGSASLLWQTLEDNVPTKYFLSPAQCSQFLRLAEIAGCPPPAEIEALLLKQGGVYRSPDPFNAMAAPTRNEAERRLDFWLEACDHLNLPEFKSCRKMLTNWRRYILNAFDIHLSNGFTEGCNNAIKPLKRLAFGFRSFSTFRARILLASRTHPYI